MRKGVPYPSEEICSLKERIAELEQRMASLVNTINHIAANSGDISIAADAPLNVTNDATAHKIEISLDTSRLPDANSIALRDANGRMYAADPASGATDRSLTTANWISQTGDNAPNNLIHKTGDETKNGLFYLPGRLILNRTADEWRQIDCFSEIPKSEAPPNNIKYGMRIYGTDGDIAFLILVRKTDGTIELVLSGNPLINGVPSWRSKTIATLR